MIYKIFYYHYTRNTIKLSDLGDISLVLNVIALFMLLIGVVGRKGSKKVLIRHGYLSVLAFALKLATVFIVMIPPIFTEFPTEIVEFSVMQLSIFVLKIFLGILGTIMGLICIIPWYFKPREEMECLKVKRWMMPTFIIWALTVLLGAVSHLTGLL